MRHLLTAVLFIAGLALPTATAAAADNLQAGRDYIVLNPAQPTRVSPGKIEIVEFFNFSCPHCHRLQGHLNKWRADNAAEDIALVHQPVVFQRYNGHFARVYYTLEGLDIADEFIPKIYTAIHTERQLLNSRGRFLDWLEDQGIDRDRADKMYDSFTVVSRAKRAADVALDYGISSTPHLAINGKYVIGPSLSRSYETMLETLSTLIDRERAALAQ